MNAHGLVGVRQSRYGLPAATPSAGATSATEDFSPPPSLLHVSTDINDNAPRGDGDGIAEPGETLTVATTLQNLTGSTISGLTGTLAMAADNGVSVTRGSAGWPPSERDRTRPTTRPLAATVPINKDLRDELHALVFPSTAPMVR